MHVGSGALGEQVDYMQWVVIAVGLHMYCTYVHVFSFFLLSTSCSESRWIATLSVSWSRPSVR